MVWASCAHEDRIVGWERCPGLEPGGQVKLGYHISFLKTEIIFLTPVFLY